MADVQFKVEDHVCLLFLSVFFICNFPTQLLHLDFIVLCSVQLYVQDQQPLSK